ncbi:alpha/beta-hydrolase [Rhizoclosmatium globosum]|uniref:Alpha/beta-hydrolase n=1 Tax=Rhizoclosmatium globosum TaxID=329046 RepID=A0A1Y2C985_9FUNG|nr:alpha/beta-hydrolase [Rhizoclosmatium globosum]|eukprot:ORY43600.1 alpha/beta-hydrolase [Rhizoclosmatium globosum]
MKLLILLALSFSLVSATPSIDPLPLEDTYGPNDPRSQLPEPQGFKNHLRHTRHEFNERMKNFASFDDLTQKRMAGYHAVESNLTNLVTEWHKTEHYQRNSNGAHSKRGWVVTGSGQDSSDFVNQMKTYTYYAGSSYCAVASLQNWSCSTCKVPNTQNVNVYSSADGSEQAYIAVNTATKTIILSFRGSHNIQNWINNIEFIQSSIPITGAPSSVQVHSGFWQVWTSVQDSTRTQLANYRKTYPDYDIVFTGHSLGASVSVLAALVSISQWGVPASKVSVINIGEPRTGNTAFYQYVLGRGFKQVSRVVNYADIVPHFPLNSWGYTHHTQEHWVDWYGDLVYCDDVSNNGEDDNCANTMPPFVSVTDHLNYFGIALGSC